VEAGIPNPQAKARYAMERVPPSSKA
jgi:hypothetical protein